MTDKLNLDAMERRAYWWRNQSPSEFDGVGIADEFSDYTLHLIARVRGLEAEHDAGLSWSGFNLHGDRKSIDEAKRLIHRDGRCADLESIVRNLEAAIATERKRCAEIARRDVDWTRFNKHEIEQWEVGADGVHEYRLGVKVGEMIALEIERGDEEQGECSTESA